MILTRQKQARPTKEEKTKCQMGSAIQQHLLRSGKIAADGDAARILGALRGSLAENDMMAYLAMMTVRLVELHRVLRPAGSLYLHCDPTASHYLKIILDSVFGPTRYTNEIVWKRSDAHNDAKQGAKHFGRVHDTLLFYRKSDSAPFEASYRPLPASIVDKWYRHVEEGSGRRYNKADVTGPGGAAKGNPYYEWNGFRAIGATARRPCSASMTRAG